MSLNVITRICNNFSTYGEVMTEMGAVVNQFYIEIWTDVKIGALMKWY